MAVKPVHKRLSVVSEEEATVQADDDEEDDDEDDKDDDEGSEGVVSVARASRCEGITVRESRVLFDRVGRHFQNLFGEL